MGKSNRIYVEFHFSFIIWFFLNLTTYNCTIKNSSFVIALTHNIKDIFSTVLSILLFADIQPDIVLTFGISLIYSLTKIQEIKKKQQQTIDLTNQEIKVLIKQ